MKRLLLIAAFLIALCVPTSAQFNGCPAGFCAPKSTAASYQGPGDAVSGAVTFYSCARVLNASLAATSTNLCDLVDSSAPTVVICTLRGSISGYVDLANAYCTGSVTPATKCAAATGGKCNISKAYNQVNPGTNDVTNATAASQPTLTFSALNSLPGMTCTNAANSVLTTSATVTQALPYTLLSVSNRTGSVTTVQGVIGENGSGTSSLGYSTSANVAQYVSAGTTATQTASDNAFHSLIGIGVAGPSFLVVDNSAGTTAGAGNAIGQPMRICRSANTASSLTGIIMEAGLWNSAFNSTNYGAMNTNQHSATSGYNF